MSSNIHGKINYQFNIKIFVNISANISMKRYIYIFMNMNNDKIFNINIAFKIKIIFD